MGGGNQAKNRRNCQNAKPQMDMIERIEAVKSISLFDQDV